MAASNHLAFDRKAMQALFRAQDALPPDLVREMCFAARVWDASNVSDIYQGAVKRRGEKATIRWIAASIEAGDEQDVQHYGMQFRQRYGFPLPHIAAQATILRFRPVVDARIGKRVRKVPLSLRAAWRATERLMPKEGLVEDRAPYLPVDDEIAGRFANLDVDAA